MSYPSEPQPDEPSELLTAVGRVTLTWAFLEIGLEGWVTVGLDCHGGLELGLVRPRESFKRKMQTVRVCLKRLPGMQPYAEALTPLLDRASALSDARHSYIHGVVCDFPIASRESPIVFVGFDHRRDGEVRETATSIKEMTALAHEIKDVALQILTLCQRALDARPRHSEPAS
jgi:hypothetical protein